MKRREFIAGGLAGGLAFAVGSRVKAQAGGASEAEKLARLSVMTYCFDRIVKGLGKPDDPDRTLDILDAPQMIADHYGIHHVEMQHTHFQATDKPYFQEMKGRLKKANSQLTQICLEFDFVDLSSKQKYQQLEMIARAAESGTADAGRGGGREVDAEADHGLREDAKGLLRHRESRRRASCAQCAAECAGARRLGSAGGSA